MTKVMQKYEFLRGKGDWDKLYNFMDRNYFTSLDFLACICAKFVKQKEKTFNTHLSVGGQIFKVNIEKVNKVSE